MILISWAKVENNSLFTYFLVCSLTLTFTSVISEIMSQAVEPEDKSSESFCLTFYVVLVLLKQKSNNLKIFDGL